MDRFNTLRVAALLLSAGWSLSPGSRAQAEDGYGHSVYAASPAAAPTPQVVESAPLPDRFYEAEWSEPTDPFTVIQPGAMAEEIDSPPWHEDEMIGPITADEMEVIEYESVQEDVRTGWSSSLDVLALWSTYSYNARDNNNVSIGTRLTLSYEDALGSGVTWRFSTVNGTNPIHVASTYSALERIDHYDDQRFDQQRLDLDFTQRVSVGKSSFRFGFGPRLARQQRRYIHKSPSRFSSYYYDTSDREYLAAGVGVSIEFERLMLSTASSELTFVGHARYGWLYGGIDNGGNSYDDMAMSVREIGGGLEWKRQWGDGDLVVSGLAEMQDYSSILGSLYHGVALRIGYEW